MTEYKTVLTDSSGEITEKKSRFIGTLHHVENEDEAVDFINEMKKKYWDARHNCSAFVAGFDDYAERANDDGEPSRTAGMPILETIKNMGLHNVCMVVTRYFGGILLGTGGLTRAYRDAATAAIESAEIITMRKLNRATVSVDYDAYGKLRYEAEKRGFRMINSSFGQLVSLEYALSGEEAAFLGQYISEITNGLRTLEILEPDWFQV
ncbi:MAG: YigZ family protein [Lachnospiraceae bacterium]|nr:YigZ family protein [Lachnospiraceae bacterium]